MSEIVLSLNSLSNVCTIIIKSFFNNDQPELKKLDKSIIVFGNTAQAPNLPRIAADYILSPFYSGTFISSLMLGINVIPFFTKTLFIRNKNFSPVNYENYIKMYMYHNPIFYNIFNLWPHFFDIIDVDKIKNAIFNNEYSNWYKENLPYLRKKILGDYMLDGADQKTAEYILRFASEGTLGNDCTSVRISG